MKFSIENHKDKSTTETAKDILPLKECFDIFKQLLYRVGYDYYEVYNIDPYKTSGKG